MPRDRLTLLVADDEPLARELVRSHVRDSTSVEIVGEAASGDELASRLIELRPDVALVDIRMPGTDVFSVLAASAKSLTVLPAIIFATAFDAYAVRAFELNAVDYLIKPFGAARLDEALRRARRHARDEGSGLARAIQDLGPAPDRLLVPDGHRMVPLALSSIVWIKAEGDYARVHSGGRGYLVARSLKDLEARLSAEQFIRIHRSAIVQASHIREVRASGRSRYRVLLSDDTAVIVSRRRAPELRRWML